MKTKRLKKRCKKYPVLPIFFLGMLFSIIHGCISAPIPKHSVHIEQGWKSFSVFWQPGGDLPEGREVKFVFTLADGSEAAQEQVFPASAGVAEFALPEFYADEISLVYIDEKGGEIPAATIDPGLDIKAPDPLKALDFDFDSDSMIISWENSNADWVFCRFSGGSEEESPEYKAAAADGRISVPLDTAAMFESFQAEVADKFGNGLLMRKQLIAGLLPPDIYEPAVCDYYRLWSRGVPADGKVMEISACADVLDGLIVLADAGQGKLLLLDRNGTIISERITGTLPVQPFGVPQDVCAYSGEYFLVADGDDGRIVFFDSSLAPGKSFSVQGPDDDFRAVPRAVFFADGKIFVTDKVNGVVKVFSPSGELQYTIGKNLLRSPSGLAVFNDGRLVVSDTALSALFIFSSEGSLIERWGGFGPKTGKLLNPEKIVIYNDIVYVLDRGKAEIHVYSDDRRDLGDIFREVPASKALEAPDSFAALSDGILLVADSKHKKLRLYVDGMQLYDEFDIFRTKDEFYVKTPEDIAVSGDNLYLLDKSRQKVLVMDRLTGEYLYSLPRRESGGPAVFFGLRGIAGGPDGDLFVSDSLLNSIIVYDGTGAFKRRIDFLYDGDERFLPGKLAFHNGELLVCRDKSNSVYRINPDSDKPQPELFISGVDNPEGMINSISVWSDYIYLSEKTSGQLLQYDSNGLLLGKSGGFGASDTGAGKLAPQRTLAADSNGYLYVSVPAEHRIRKYFQAEELLGRLKFVPSPEKPAEAVSRELRDQLFAPKRVCIAPDGTLYIADSGRKKVFACRPFPKFIGKY